MASSLHQQTWILLKQGDYQAFESVYRHNYPVMYRYSLRIISDNILVDQCIQDVFVKIWECRDRIAEVKNPRAYLLTVLRRELLLKKHRDSKILYSSDDLPSFSYSPQDLQFREEEVQRCRETITNALNNLPERQREAIYLKFYERLSGQEIADIMGVRCQSVQNFIYRGMLALREDKTLQQASSVHLIGVEYVALILTFIKGISS